MAKRRTSSSASTWRSSPNRHRSEFARLLAVAVGENVRLLSSANNRYNTDYYAEDEKQSQMPMLNVFAKRGDDIYHTYGSELLYAPTDPGMDGRHVDMIWPLWNMLDYTPDGRGTTWGPKLSY